MRLEVFWLKSHSLTKDMVVIRPENRPSILTDCSSSGLGYVSARGCQHPLQASFYIKTFGP